jgi:hypothetical protein
MTEPPRHSAVVLVQVQAQRPLRRGTTALVVTATIGTPHGAAPVDVTASRDLDMARPRTSSRACWVSGR